MNDTSSLPKPRRGFFPPAFVKGVAFYVISLCILSGVVVCILAIWDFTRPATLWRFGSSLLVVGSGTLLFALLNGFFGDEKKS
jgi:hypothetical protein